MNRGDVLHFLSRRARVSLLVLALVTLGACGSGEPAQPIEGGAAPATTTAVTAAPATNETPAAPATSETPAAATEQVSETGDGAESVGEAPASQTTAPTLRLATVAPEPKNAPSTFKEGVHYQVLVPTQPTAVSAGQVEVVEIFWYGCPHCFALDPKLETWRQNQKDKANYLVFRRIPATWNDATLFHGRLFYTAELLGKLEELHTPIFREINLNGNMLNTMDKAKAFFTAQGVAKAEFDKVFASFGLEAKLQNANMLNKRYRVQGVPYFVVNGKYTADVSSAGGEEQLLQLLSELAAREHGG